MHRIGSASVLLLHLRKDFPLVFPTFRVLCVLCRALLFLRCLFCRRLEVVILKYNLDAGLEHRFDGLRDEVLHVSNGLIGSNFAGCPCDMNLGGITSHPLDRVHIVLFFTLEFAPLFCFLCAPFKRRLRPPAHKTNRGHLSRRSHSELFAEERSDLSSVFGDWLQLQRAQFMQHVLDGDIRHGTFLDPNSLVRLDHVGVRCPFALSAPHVAP